MTKIREMRYSKLLVQKKDILNYHYIFYLSQYFWKLNKRALLGFVVTQIIFYNNSQMTFVF